MRPWITLLLLTACGASAEDKADKKQECDAIAASIRSAAVARGVSSTGACSSQGPVEFKASCESLRTCNAELDDM